MSRILRRVVALAGALAAVMSWPAPAFAHPLGNFTVNVSAGIHVLAGEVRVDYVVDLAEIPTLQEMAAIDTDGDEETSPVERAAWSDRTARELLSGLSVSVGGRTVSLRVVDAGASVAPGQAGLPVLRLEATFVGPIPDVGVLRFEDGNYPGRIGWREVTAVGEAGATVLRATVPADSPSDELRAYPEELLQSPLHIVEATVAFEPGSGAPAPSGSERPAGDDGRPAAAGGGFGGLVSSSGAPLLVLSLVLAVGFGAIHALGPGHGKTLMAAYLVGAGGRARHAAAVAAAVAAMHSVSVVALALVVLSAERVVPPERLYPWLGVGSGVAALLLGVGLLVARARALRRPGRSSGNHHHDGPGEHVHPSSVREAPALSRRRIAALALAGGILPSPTAVVVLLGSVALGRAVFGLALVAAFSLGLAAALTIVGVLAIRARDLLAHRAPSRWARLVPVVSASGITAMGLVLAARGLGQL